MPYMSIYTGYIFMYGTETPCTYVHIHPPKSMLLYQSQLTWAGRRQEQYVQIALLSLIAYALFFLVTTPGWALS